MTFLKWCIATCIYETDWPMNFYQYANITDISTDVANSSTDINASIILVSVMDVLMLKIWPILANTDTDINIGVSLAFFISPNPFCSTQPS